MPSATAPTRTGYTFQGYFDQTNGNGTRYYNANMTSARTWDKTQNTTLYAHWVANTYTVSYNANGATSGSVPASQTKTHDVNLTLRTNSGNLQRTGYTFAGWNTAANGSGTDYAAGGTYSANATVTLYAKWTANTYTVSYNANGATSGTVPASQEKVHGVNLTLRTNSGNLARTGYTFAGWNTQANGNGTDYTAGGTYTANASVTLYAKWTQDAATYTVSYNANGATSGSAPASQTKTHDVNLTLRTNSGNLTRTGYTFSSWNTQSNGSGTDYAAGGTYSANAAVTLYAKWASDDPGGPGGYMVIDLSGGTSAANYPVSYLSAVPAGGWTDEYKTTKLVMRRIPAGTFTMGSPAGELGRAGGEDQRQVTLSKDFYIGIFPVTQKQWERVMDNWPSYFNSAAYRDSRPVDFVSYYEIRENPNNSTISPNWPQSAQVHELSFIGKLREKTWFASLDLPTEAQWEYACRAGTATALNSGKNLTAEDSCPNMSEVGRYRWSHPGGVLPSSSVDTDGGTPKVGSYLPNVWGLYDMHGSVYEWCLDWYAETPPGTTDPVGAASGESRVIRGGSWSAWACYCRSAFRNVTQFNPGLTGNSFIGGHGFRLAMTLSPMNLTVVSGTGGGAYAAGTAVFVTADSAPASQVFSHWTVNPSGANLGASFNSTQSSTTVTMPPHDVTLTANYGSLSISPTNRSHTSAAATGQEIEVTASQYWTGVSDAGWMTLEGAWVSSGGGQPYVDGGAGSETVKYSISANAGAERSGTITFSGGSITHVFTVTQSAPPDTTPPTVTIKAPTSATMWSTMKATINIGGTASDNVGVTSVKVVNAQDGIERNATGTTSWQLNNLQLYEGQNIISVTASDAAGNPGADTIVVYQVNSIPPNDFDGDGVSDQAIFDTRGGLWYTKTVAGNVISWKDQWGWSTAKPVPGDYSGNGKADQAIFDTVGGYWYIKTVAGNVIKWADQWGWTGALAVPGDYDGDGISDQAIFDTNGGNWYIKSVAGNVISWADQWGWSTAKPVPGDYNGDGKHDLAVFDTVGGYWYIKTTAGNVIKWADQWGWTGALAVPGDYDGDGISDQAIFDTNGGFWYIKRTTGEVITWANQWGWPTAVPVPGDYNGDGKHDLAVFDSATGRWYIKSVSGTVIKWEDGWGWPGAFPVGKAK